MAQDQSQKSRKAEDAIESMPVETEALIELALNHLLEAEANFLSLYDVAIRKLQAERLREKLTAFRGDHERHVGEIVGCLEQLEGAVLVERAQPTPMAMAVAERLEATGSDEELLGEFLASEDFARHLYSWLGSTPAPEPVARIAERGLRDEERHYAFVAKELGIGEE